VKHRFFYSYYEHLEDAPFNETGVGGRKMNKSFREIIVGYT
jgi:hypothetical protein